MRNRLQYLSRYLPWFLLLLGLDAMSALLLWLSDAKAFAVLLPTILLATVLLFIIVAFILAHAERRKENAFRVFLNHPDALNEEKLLRTVSASERESLRLLGNILREKELLRSRAEAAAEDYEEYVEAWAHETKTPLSLLTMVLDNQGDEIPAPAAFKLEYVRSQLQEHINQILYYARLKSARKDYLFEHLDLNVCIEEVLEEYGLLLKEKDFQVSIRMPSIKVFTDRRGIRFLIGQIVSNAVKYSSDSPKLTITLEQEETAEILRIRDFSVEYVRRNFAALESLRALCSAYAGIVISRLVHARCRACKIFV